MLLVLYPQVTGERLGGTVGHRCPLMRQVLEALAEYSLAPLCRGRGKQV